MERTRHIIAASLIAFVAAAGCSAAGVPISEPEHVSPLSTAAPLSELEAIAWSIRDVINVAVPDLLRAPPGDLAKQLTATGTMTIAGSAAQPSDTAETLTLTVAYDGYRPIIKAAVPFTDFQLSSGSPPPTLTLDFTEPATAHDLGSIGGEFAGTVTLSRANSDYSEPVDARFTITGQLEPDSAGTLAWQVLRVSGVIHSATSGYYYNEASFPWAGAQ